MAEAVQVQGTGSEWRTSCKHCGMPCAVDDGHVVHADDGSLSCTWRSGPLEVFGRAEVPSHSRHKLPKYEGKNND